MSEDNQIYERPPDLIGHLENQDLVKGNNHGKHPESFSRRRVRYKASKERPRATRRCHYLSNGVNSSAAKINAMEDRAPEIGLRDGLRFKDDWRVACYVSRYAGRRYYYVDHSCIKYIFYRRPTRDL